MPFLLFYFFCLPFFLLWFFLVEKYYFIFCMPFLLFHIFFRKNINNNLFCIVPCLENYYLHAIFSLKGNFNIICMKKIINHWDIIYNPMSSTIMFYMPFFFWNSILRKSVGNHRLKKRFRHKSTSEVQNIFSNCGQKQFFIYIFIHHE